MSYKFTRIGTKTLWCLQDHDTFERSKRRIMSSHSFHVLCQGDCKAKMVRDVYSGKCWQPKENRCSSEDIDKAVSEHAYCLPHTLIPRVSSDLFTSYAVHRSLFTHSVLCILAMPHTFRTDTRSLSTCFS